MGTGDPRQEDSYWKKLFEGALDAVSVLDAHGTVLYESAACERIHGLSLQDRVGSKALSLVREEELGPVRDKLAHLIAQPGVSMTHDFHICLMGGS